MICWNPINHFLRMDCSLEKILHIVNMRKMLCAKMLLTACCCDGSLVQIFPRDKNFLIFRNILGMVGLHTGWWCGSRGEGGCWSRGGGGWRGRSGGHWVRGSWGAGRGQRKRAAVRCATAVLGLRPSRSFPGRRGLGGRPGRRQKLPEKIIWYGG